MNIRINVAAALVLFSVLQPLVHAHQSGPRADSHAPIGVMGDHMHKKGEFMISYRHMQMSMSGNQRGKDELSDEEIATTIPNRFGMPPTLRIVPQDMTVKMDMFGFMYAPSDRVTLMLMLNHLNKDMQLRTFAGMMGTNVRGLFNTESSGFGDTKVGALVSLLDTPSRKMHLNLGLSLPTGAIDNRGGVLTPMAMRDNPMLMDLRLPYAMQLGSGTYDVEPGITYLAYGKAHSWGLQYKAIVRTGENDEGYTLGDQHQFQAWGQYLFSPAISTSLRAEAKTLSSIDGMDEQIRGPVQTADPDSYGGDYVNAAVGVNYYAQSGFLKNHRFAFEYSVPLLQDVNGVQMTMENMFTLGYQYAF